MTLDLWHREVLGEECGALGGSRRTAFVPLSARRKSFRITTSARTLMVYEVDALTAT
jgi:hypothetical protein